MVELRKNTLIKKSMLRMYMIQNRETCVKELQYS